MPSRAPFLARWSPRIGRKAARLHLLTGPSTTIGIWSAPIWVILYVIGQGWSKMCAYAVAGLGFACLAFAAVCMHLMFKALSERFGFRVTWRNAPPYRYKAFGAWCRSHGLNPATGRPPGAHLLRERPVRRLPAHRVRPQVHRDDAHAELRAAGRQTT
ncbi:MAG: hypothetical protein ABSD85_02150 [Acidimicrobiales bacterium]|jgi:hypothetical protein